LGVFPDVDPDLGSGGAARLLVHSEDLVLCRREGVPSGLVSVPGAIATVSFAGRENQVVVTTDSGRQATAYARVGDAWTAGDEVRLAFPRPAAWVFPHARRERPDSNEPSLRATASRPAASTSA
jgi:hypothetical protein